MTRWEVMARKKEDVVKRLGIGIIILDFELTKMYGQYKYEKFVSAGD